MPQDRMEHDRVENDRMEVVAMQTEKPAAVPVSKVPHRIVVWERRSALPLTILSLLFLVVYALPILRPDLPDGWRAACTGATLLIWAVFWIDFLTRLVLVSHRGLFLREHLFDLAVLLLPAVRPLRAVRLVTAVLTISRRTGRWARGRLAAYVGTTTVLLIGVAGLAVLDAERDAPDSSITTFGDALWWATVTITTVGYGDRFPVTTTGRMVALGLMIGGIGLIGFVTGSLASWIVERVGQADGPEEVTRADIMALRAEVAALRRLIENRVPGADTPAGARGSGEAGGPP